MTTRALIVKLLADILVVKNSAIVGMAKVEWILEYKLEKSKKYKFGLFSNSVFSHI